MPRACVSLLSTILIHAPTSVAGGTFLSDTGRYKFFHLIVLLMIFPASRLCIGYNHNLSLVNIVRYQMIAGTDTEILGHLPIFTFPSQLAPDESKLFTAFIPDSGSILTSHGQYYPFCCTGHPGRALSPWRPEPFGRLFRISWGISIPASIFNSRFEVEYITHNKVPHRQSRAIRKWPKI